MLFYVVKCFTVNLKEFAAHTVGSLNLNRINENVEGECGLVSEAFGETDHEIDEVGALDADRAHVGHHAAELGGLAFDGLLEVGEAREGLVGAGCSLFSEHVELNFKTEQGLEDAVVKVAGDTAAFGLDSAGAQVTKEKDVLKGGADVAGDAFEPSQVVPGVLATAVEEEEAASGFATLVESDRHHGFEIEQLLGRAGKARDAFESAAVATVPSKAGTGAREAIPADGSVGVVKEKSVGPGEGQVVGHEAFGLAGFVAPEEDALEIGVAIDEQGFLGVKSTGKLFEEETQALGKALIDFHGGGDTGEEFLLDGEEAVAVAQESDAGSSRECCTSQAEPGNDAEEVDLAFDDGEENNFKGEQASQGKSGVQSPADTRHITDEQIRKPCGNHRGADDHEIAEGDEVDEQREMPGPTWENLFEEDGAERQY